MLPARHPSMRRWLGERACLNEETEALITRHLEADPITVKPAFDKQRVRARLMEIRQAKASEVAHSNAIFVASIHHHVFR
ncbi:hypothetical protein D9M69_594450 [compost metagenome]